MKFLLNKNASTLLSHGDMLQFLIGCADFVTFGIGGNRVLDDPASVSNIARSCTRNRMLGVVNVNLQFRYARRCKVKFFINNTVWLRNVTAVIEISQKIVSNTCITASSYNMKFTFTVFYLFCLYYARIIVSNLDFVHLTKFNKFSVFFLLMGVRGRS